MSSTEFEEMASSESTAEISDSKEIHSQPSIIMSDESKEVSSTELTENPSSETGQISSEELKELSSADSKDISPVQWTEEVSTEIQGVASTESEDKSSEGSKQVLFEEMPPAESRQISPEELKGMSAEESKDQSSADSEELPMEGLKDILSVQSNEVSPTMINETSSTKSQETMSLGEGSGHKILGVELAPVNIPFHRRIEMFAVLLRLSLFLFFGFISVILSVILLFTDYYWLSLILYATMIYDRHTPHTGGRSWGWFRRLHIWKHLANYYPVHLYKTADLDPNYNYLFGFHPHGIIVSGGFVNFCTEATGFSQLFPGITPHMLSLAGFFQYPFAREYLLATGLCAASSESFDNLLGKSVSGTAAIIVVGGAVEVLEAYPNHYSVYLSRRKGFVRKAIQHGAHLVPVYSFGETDLYDQYTMAEGSWKRAIQVKFNKIVGFPPILFYGRGVFNYSLGLIPHRRPINTVVGRPIRIQMNPHPTKTQIEEVHREYMDSLRALFDAHKERFGLAKDEQLEII